MISLLANRYQIIKLIGQGGMADVYLAYDKVLKREVAIKILKNELSNDHVAIERFNKEARSSASLVHPNIIEIYDANQFQNYTYLVMEYVKGQNLNSLIKQRGCLNIREAIMIIKQIILGIMEAHKHNIIHRDIKPQNIIVQNDGEIKILDFGIAVVSEKKKSKEKSPVVGSAHYIAPELLTGKQANMASDIYSIGIVFYEMLTGKTPYSGENVVSIALKHANEDIPSVKAFDNSFPQSIDNILIKACAKSPDNRYPNLAYMLRDVNNALSEDINASVVKIDKNKEKEAISKIHKNNQEILGEKKAKKRINPRTILLTLFAILGSLLAFALVFILLWVNGFFGGGNNSIVLPDIYNKNIADANQILKQYDISIDMYTIKRSYNDVVTKNNIISTTPEIGSEVLKGSKIQVELSNGLYPRMQDFTGYDINEAYNALIGTPGITSIKKEIVENDTKDNYGKVVSQEGLLPNEIIDENNQYEIILYYYDYKSVMINMEDFEGKNIHEVSDYFTNMGFKVSLVALEGQKDESIATNTVVSITSGKFEQKQDNSIEIKYYKD